MGARKYTKNFFKKQIYFCCFVIFLPYLCSVIIKQQLVMNAQLKAEIKDAIWELKNAKETITVKSVFDKANGKISFNDLPKILEYLESIKDKFLFTYCKGYLELNVMEKININQYVSRG